MLKHLYIKNFTLINQLDIDFRNGFSVISGETGAGKSIILGAIGLLLGNRADSKQIKQGEKKCVIEATFSLPKGAFDTFFTDNNIDFDADDTILRREVGSNGKSRAFINDTPVALNLMREVGDQLVDIHSQHQNLLLQKEDFQLNVIDILAANDKDMAAYKATFKAYKDAEKRLEQIRNQLKENAENEEFMRFQHEELSGANLQEGQQEELETESKTLSHAEDIKASLYNADNALNDDETGAVKQLKSAAEAIASIANVFPKAKELCNRLDTAYIEVKDIAEEVSRATGDIDFDPNRLDYINEQLDKIYHLEKKFHVETIEELLAIQAELKQKLDGIDNSDELLKEAEQELAAKQADWQREGCKGYSEGDERETRAYGHTQRAVRHSVRAKATGCRRCRQGAIPFLCQPQQSAATHCTSGFGWRNSPRHALAQGDDKRCCKAANHYFRRNRHRRKRQDCPANGFRNATDGQQQQAGNLHNTPSADCSIGHNAL